MKFNNLNRRSFLQGACGMALFCSAPTVLAAGDRQSLVERLAAFVPAPDSASHLGRVYLTAFNRSPDPADLVLRVLAGRATVPELNCLPTPDLHMRLHDWIHTDFSTRTTCRLDGWVLAQTEVNLFALMAVLFEAPQT